MIRDDITLRVNSGVEDLVNHLVVVGILRYVCVSFSNEEELAAYGFLNHLILDCHQDLLLLPNMIYSPPFDILSVMGFIVTATGLAVAFDKRSLQDMFFVKRYHTYEHHLPLIVVGLNWLVSWVFVTTLCLESCETRLLHTAQTLSGLSTTSKNLDRYSPLLLGSLWYLVTMFACLSLNSRNGQHLTSRSSTVCGIPHPVALYWVTTALVLAVDKNPIEAAVLVITHLIAIVLYKLYLTREIRKAPKRSPSKVGLFCGALLLVVAPLTASLIATTILIYALLNRFCWGVLTPQSWRQIVKEKGRGILRMVARTIMSQERLYVYLPTYVLALVIPIFLTCIFFKEKSAPYEGVFIVNPVHFVAYHLFRLGPYFSFFAHTHAIVHIEAHSSVPMFRGSWRIFNRLIEWGAFMFYGGVPEGYKIGHNKVHHKYNNGLLDDSATMEFDRNHPRQFILYLAKFYLFWSGLSVSWHLYMRGEKGLAWKQLKGTLAFYGIMLALLMLDWRFAVAYWVYPHIEATTLLAAINYTWHAWVDPRDPDNDYITSITILDGHYNTFEADFHVVHHQHPTLWYEDCPKVFDKEIEVYKKQKATIFRGTQAFELFILIVTNNIDRLATLFVDLSGELSHEEIKELLRYRMSAIPAS